MIRRVYSESKKSELEMGIKIEKEHTATWKKIKAGKITTLEEMAESIATDHLNEHKDYYTKLTEAKL